MAEQGGKAKKLRLNLMVFLTTLCALGREAKIKFFAQNFKILQIRVKKTFEIFNVFFSKF